jgi:hypothetical protein
MHEVGPSLFNTVFINTNSKCNGLLFIVVNVMLEVEANYLFPAWLFELFDCVGNLPVCFQIIDEYKFRDVFCFMNTPFYVSFL